VVVAAAEEFQHMLVVEGVVGGPTLPAGAHQALHPEDPEVVRRSRLGDPEELGEIVDT